MIRQKRRWAASLGILLLGWFCLPIAGADENAESKPEISAGSADSRPPGQVGENGGRRPGPRDGNRPPGSQPGADFPRRDDKFPGREEQRRGFPRGGPGQSEPFNQQRWPAGEPEWLRNNDPEMFKLIDDESKLDRQTRELGVEYRRSSKDAQAAVKKKLGGLVAEQFEARQRRRGLELKRLEEELQRIRASIEKGEAAKQLIVDRRVAELAGEEPQF